ncbi:MAG: transglutaminase domain-containing protein [Candidatus Lokiarchaeota archaeon]|nr:transglutaminase domain-containing protein [Candidatus Lokiarchaeota archaeon]
MNQNEYLQSNEFFDFNKKRVKQKAFEIVKDLSSKKEMLIALFYWVRDNIKYNMMSYVPEIKANFKASVTLRRKYGFCLSKSVLLSTFARAIGLPARIHAVDIINHKISPKVIDLMETNVFHYHAYSEVYIGGKWIKLAPVFDKNTAVKGGFLPLVEFDGENDALFSSTDLEGKPFVEYVKDRGTHETVPIEDIRRLFSKKYKKLSDIPFPPRPMRNDAMSYK